MGMRAEHSDSEGDCNKDDPDNKNAFTRGSFYLLLATAAFTGWYAFTARDTEKRQLRAYVGPVLESFEFHPVCGEDGNCISFSIRTMG